MTVRGRLTGKGTASSTHSVSLPGTAQTGDRVLVGFVNDHAHATAAPSTGWDTLGTEDQGTTTNHRLTVFSRVLTGGGQDALTVTITDATDGAARDAAWAVVALQGDGGTPAVVFNDGGSATSATVGAVTGLASGDYDSVIFLGLDNSTGVSQSPAVPSGWSNLTGGGVTADEVYGWSLDRSLTGVTDVTPANITGITSEQWITAHVVTAQVSAAPITKSGTDTALGTESGGAEATPAGTDTALGTESGGLAFDGVDTALGTDDGYVAEGRDAGESSLGTESGDSSATVTSGESAGATELGNTAADLAPPSDQALGDAEFGHVAIPGSDTALASDLHDGPTQVTSTSGEVALAQDGGYVETLYADLVIALFGIDPDTGVAVPLPHFTKFSIGRERNSRGSIALEYPADGKNFELLRECITDDRDLEVEIWVSGSPVGALRGLLQEAAGDDTDETAVWQFAGSFDECRADEAVIFPQDRGSLVTDPNTGELVYTNPKREYIVREDTPGTAVLTLWEQAQDRGTLVGIVPDFSATHDSNGVAWAGLLTGKFAPGTTYGQFLGKLVDLGLAEWAIVWDGTQRVLKLWNNEGRGADLTLGPRPVILRRARNILSAPRKWSVRESVTRLLAAGAEGIYDDAVDATAEARRGRQIEGYASLGSSSDEEAVLGFAQAELKLSASGMHSVEHGIGFLPGEPRPIIAFDVGDWVYSQSTTAMERLRVVQWTLEVDSQYQASGTVTLNDVTTDMLVRLAEQVAAISAGETVIGASEPGDGGTEVDRTPPAAPQGVVASSIAYQNPDTQGAAQTLAFVTVGWLPVTTNADGSDSPLVQAAVYVRDKIGDEISNPPDPESPSYAPFDEATWTWKDCPRVVQDFGPKVRELWVADGSPNKLAWLADYIGEATQTPTVADDVAGYHVRYSYQGLAQVGGLPSSDPFPDEDRFYYLATPPSGTASNSFSFGGVEGGSAIRIEVAAFDRAGNQGAWTTIAHETAGDTTPPPVTSAPQVKVWFRTLDIGWDGLGAEGEVMPIDFARARVWIGQGSDMTLPGEPVEGPVEFDPTETGPQYVRDIVLGAGVVNVPDLAVGVGYYVCLQSVDESGNAAERSEVMGPFTAQQLVGQDILDGIIDATKIGPDSIESQHIVNGAITTAKIGEAQILSAQIGLAQINTAHIEEISAGKITAGTMSATVILGGSFWTSTNTSANRMGFTSGGLQMYRGTTLVGEWKVSDGSMLVTGTYRSGTSGPRIEIKTDGSMDLYPTSGTNKSTIKNENGEMVWRGPLDSGSRSGRVNVNMLGIGLNFSKENDLLENIRAEILVLDRQLRYTAPFINFQVSEMWSSPVSGVNNGRRMQFSFIDSDGDFISRSGLSYITDPSTNAGGFVGNDAGWKLDLNGNGDGRFMVTNGTMTGFGVAQATAWDGPCSEVIKDEIADARTLLDPIEVLRGARSRKYRLPAEGQDGPIRLGPIAEEIPAVLQRPMTIPGTGDEIIGMSLNDQIGLLWAAFNQLIDQEPRSVVGRAAVPNKAYRAGDVVTLTVPWDETPLEVPTDVTAIPFFAMPTADGNVRVSVVPGSASTTGCQVRVQFSGTVAVTSGLVARVEVVGRYIWTPPPPEG